jgi:hypothetical protein
MKDHTGTFIERTDEPPSTQEALSTARDRLHTAMSMVMTEFTFTNDDGEPELEYPGTRIINELNFVSDSLAYVLDLLGK